MQVFSADGTCWQPGRPANEKHHLNQVKFYQDVVNYSPTEHFLWDEGELDYSGWAFHRRSAYLGNEGNVEETMYSRYILMFCRREAADACQPGDVELDDQDEVDEVQMDVDLEMRALGIMNFGEKQHV